MMLSIHHTITPPNRAMQFSTWQLYIMTTPAKIHHCINYKAQLASLAEKHLRLSRIKNFYHTVYNY